MPLLRDRAYHRRHIRVTHLRRLLKSDQALQPVLRKSGYRTRDARIKERKKPGLKRARKAKQYTKR